MTSATAARPTEQRRADPAGGGRSGTWPGPRQLAALVAVPLAAYATLLMVRALRGILIMLLVSLFLECALEPAVQFLARKGWRRGVATGAVFAAVIIAEVGTVTMAPLVVTQVGNLIDRIPNLIDATSRWLNGLPLGLDLHAGPDLRAQALEFARSSGESLRSHALGAAGSVLSIGGTAFGALGQVLAVGLITFYLVADGPRFRRTLARPLPPARQREMLALWELVPCQATFARLMSSCRARSWALRLRQAM